MSSISSLGSSSYQSPRDLLQQELLKEISSGTISSSDQDALSSALDDIDSSLTSDRASSTSGASKSSPQDIKSKIDDLITNEVNSGKLTSDQATELQSLFSNAFAGGAHGAGGPNGAGGPPPGPPPSGGTDDSSSTDSSSGTNDVTKMLEDFLKSVQDSQSSSVSYSASGDTSTTASSLAAILLDYQA